MKAIVSQIDVYIQFDDENELTNWEASVKPRFLGQQTPNSYIYVVEGKIICAYIPPKKRKQEEKTEVAPVAGR